MKNKIPLLELKQQAFNHCHSFVKGRLERLQHQMKEIETALTSETKSSAGDKHETGRAMLQLEREKLGTQLVEAEQMHGTLQKVATTTEHNRAGLGAVVVTDKQSYYIAISAGALTYKEVSLFCISPGTPIGKLLLGKQTGDTIQFNQSTSTILNIR
ncbi:GreA/GreB family elongation factor [Maribacter sp. 4U21]|uniref:GreA/GreB family elongation factor n=1 Tax=Maribacter sp. 4U21 TaxID=1889779 RepID=UPI00211F3C92|nr:GreA/GreB family elongation factor [Maribacter sp. 4U21]